MKDNVTISVIGTQADVADDETIELQTTGKWYSKSGKEHILYTNHELVETGETKTRVSIDGQVVSIIRSGAINTHLVFEEGISHIIPYETPFGLLDMVSHTKSISTRISDDSIEVNVVYNLDINNTNMGESTFHLIAQKMR